MSTPPPPSPPTLTPLPLMACVLCFFSRSDLGVRIRGLEPDHLRKPRQRVEPGVPRVAPRALVLPPHHQRCQHHHLLDVLLVSFFAGRRVSRETGWGRGRGVEYHYQVVPKFWGSVVQIVLCCYNNIVQLIMSSRKLITRASQL